MKKIAVLYLARVAEGLSTFKRFADSYRQYEAGQDHELIIIYKGSFKKGEKEKAEYIFRDIPHRSFFISDEGYDIHAYLNVATKIDHEFICIFNTFTVLLSLHWLGKLYTHLKKPGVGMVGTSASYESLLDSNKLLKHVIWLYSRDDCQVHAELERYFYWIIRGCSLKARLKNMFNIRLWNRKKFIKAIVGCFYPLFYVIWKILGKILPNSKITNRLGDWVCSYGLIYSYIKWTIKLILNKRSGVFVGDAIENNVYKKVNFEKEWEYSLKDGNIFNFLSHFSPFPNPHLRSNGLMLPRKFLLKFKGLEKTKEACCIFESGFDGITNRILKEGLSVLLVGADGLAYSIEDWPKSRTFRLEQQQNLITMDNQVINYCSLSEEERNVHVYMTWGDYAETHVPIVTNLGHTFKMSNLVTLSTDKIPIYKNLSL